MRRGPLLLSVRGRMRGAFSRTCARVQCVVTVRRPWPGVCSAMETKKCNSDVKAKRLSLSPLPLPSPLPPDA